MEKKKCNCMPKCECGPKCTCKDTKKTTKTCKKGKNTSW